MRRGYPFKDQPRRRCCRWYRRRASRKGNHRREGRFRAGGRVEVINSLGTISPGLPVRWDRESDYHQLGKRSVDEHFVDVPGNGSVPEGLPLRCRLKAFTLKRSPGDGVCLLKERLSPPTISSKRSVGCHFSASSAEGAEPFQGYCFSEMEARGRKSRHRTIRGLLVHLFLPRIAASLRPPPYPDRLPAAPVTSLHNEVLALEPGMREEY